MDAIAAVRDLVHFPVPGRIKPRYQCLVGKLSVNDVEQDLLTSQDTLQKLLTGLDIKAAGYSLETYLGLSRYAINGDSRYLLSLARSGQSTLSVQLTKTMGMLELLQAFEQVCATLEMSVPLLLMLNMFRPRVVIDRDRLGDNEAGSISLLELALLAGMQESSVRNCAVAGNANFIQTFQQEGTRVLPADAHEWLGRRRRYRPTVLPAGTSECRLLRTFLSGFDDPA